jgi:hypothetical protein
MERPILVRMTQNLRMYMAIEKEWRTAKERYEKCDNYGEENKKKRKQKKKWKFKQMCIWLEEKKNERIIKIMANVTTSAVKTITTDKKAEKS